MKDYRIDPAIAENMQARIKSLFEKQFDAIEKGKKDQAATGTFDVIISTESVDRAGEIVKQDGWDLANYKNNPVVLWGHDYWSIPIGVCTETYLTTYRGQPALGARGFFFSEDINPLAQQVRRMYDLGVKSGSNVGCTTSVGFIPKDFDPNNQNIITRAELLEFSFVPIPAQQDVGPASGRALTAIEATELGLDMMQLRSKGFEFIERKAAQIGDSCETDDGSPGILVSDPDDADGPLVCLPQEDDKSAKGEDKNDNMDKLQKAVTDEHERHHGGVEKALAEFRTKAAAVVEDQPDENDDEDKKKALKEKAVSEMMKHVKDLRDALHDEHDMHRSKNVESFRDAKMDVSEGHEKSFDKAPHLDALKAEHDKYDEKCDKACDQFEDKMKSVEGNADEHTDWITEKLQTAQGSHLKTVMKCAKAMCKEGFAESDHEDDEANEKYFVGIVTALKLHEEYGITPEISAEIAEKIGASLSAATKDKLKEAHDHIMKGAAIVSEMHGGLGKDKESEDKDEEEEDGKKGQIASVEDVELGSFVETRELARSLAGPLNEFLARSKKDLKAYYGNRK